MIFVGRAFSVRPWDDVVYIGTRCIAAIALNATVLASKPVTL
jgi:hypothetical protein